MSVIGNIERLFQTGKISNLMKTSLHGGAEALERIANLAITKGRSLSVEDEAKFVNLYREYATVALRERQGQRLAGLVDDAKINAEIRDDFFNGVLGGIGKTDERALLRAVLTRRALAPSGLEVTLQNGLGKMSKAEYEGYRTATPEMAKLFTDEAMIAKWKLVQNNEDILLKERVRLAKRADTTDSATASAKDTARTQALEAQRAERERVAQQARETSERQARDAAAAQAKREADAAAAKSSNTGGLSVGEMAKIADHVKTDPNFDPALARIAFPDEADFAIWQKYRNAVTKEKMGDAIPDTARKLSRSVGNTDRMDVDDVFNKLAGWMRDPAQGQLVKTLGETGRQKELGSYKSIATAIQNGEKVTDDEFFALAKFFNANLDTIAQRAVPQANPNLIMGASGKPLNTIMMGIGKVTDMLAANAAGNQKRASRGLLAEWESPDRVRPSIFSLQGLGNSILDNPKTSTAIGATLLVGGNFLSTLYNPREASTISAGVFQLIYPGSWFTNDKALEAEDDVTIRQVMQYRSGAGVTKQFVEDTKKFTGVDIQAANKDGTAATVLDPKTLYDISSALQTRGTSGYNPRDFKAYLFALYGFSNASVPQGADGKATGTDDMIAKLVKHNEQAQIAGVTTALLAGQGTTPEFIAKTKQFAGIDLAREGGKSAELDPEILYRISVGLQTRGIGNFNNREVAGYIQALASKSLVSTEGLEKDAKGETSEKSNGALLSRIVDKTRENYAQSVTNRLIAIDGADKSFRDDYFKRYLGVAALPADPLALNKAVALKFSSSLGTSDLTQPVIKKYLMVAGGFKEEDLSATGIIEALRKREDQERERIGAEARTSETAGLAGLGASLANGEVRQTSTRQSAAPPSMVTAFRKVSTVFDDMTADDSFGLKGKKSILDNAFKAASTGDTFDKNKFAVKLIAAGVNEEAINVLKAQVDMALTPR